MAIQIGSVLAAVRARVSASARFFGEHRFWLELGVVTTLALWTAAAIARGAMHREEKLRAQGTELQASRIGIDRWVRDFRAPSPEESLIWRQSQAALAELDGRDSNALSVARQVAQRAEQLGITDIHLRLESVDSSAAQAPHSIGPWSISFGSEAILVEFIGGLPDILSFVGVLPPQVEIESLRVSREGPELRARLRLFVRRVTVRA